MNRKRGLLAVVMALAMVFAATTFVVGEADATATAETGVASITTDSNTKYYLTLDAALADANGKTVVLLKDIALDAAVTISTGTITISGGEAGKKITTADGKNMTVSGGAKVTFENITFENNIEKNNAVNVNEDSTEVTLDGCVFTGSSIYAFKAFDGKITVKDAQFNGKRFTVVAPAAVDIQKATGLWLNLEEKGTFTMIKGDAAPADGNIKVVDNMLIDTLVVRYDSTLTMTGVSLQVGNLMGKLEGKTNAPKIVNGTISGATIMKYEEDDSALEISGTTLAGSTVIQTGIAVEFDGAVVAQKAKLTVAKDSTAKGSITNYGTINLYENIGIPAQAGSSAVVGSVTNNGTVNILSKDVDPTVTTITGGTVDTSAVNSNVNLDGGLSGEVTYNQYQTVTVVGDTTIVDKGTLTVGGILIIEEGVTLTIEEGGILTVNTVYGKVQNDGTIVVEGTLTISGANVENNGTIVADSDKSVSVNIGGNLVNAGTFEITEGDVVNIEQKITNKSGASLEIYGELTMGGSAVIDNAGTVTIDGKCSATINQTADGATVIVTEVVGSITVQDRTFEKTGSKTLTNKTTRNAIQAVASSDNTVGGFTVTTSVYTDVDDEGQTHYYKQMSISGSIIADNEVDDNATAQVYLAGNGSTICVADTLSIGDGVIVTNYGILEVVGEVNVTEDATLTNSGSVYIDGKVAIVEDPLAGNVCAVEYIVTVGTDKTYYYTTLAAAIDGASAAGVKKVEILGNIVIKEDVTVPAGMTVNQDAAAATSVVIGEDADATVTVTEGGKFALITDTVEVAKGTLYIADKKTGITKGAAVKSEVMSEGDKDLRYTTLANAIAAAGTDAVTIKLNGPVIIESDLTIPENITVDTSDQNFQVKGATLTIDGTFFLNGGAYTVVDAPKANGTTAEGKVVLNGYMKSEAAMTYTDGKTYPAGAYYTMDYVYYITSVKNSPAIINDADECTVNIYGTNKVGDIAYAGTSDASVKVNVRGDLEAGTVSVDYGTTEFFGKAFIGKISNGTGTVALHGTATAGFKAISATDKDGVETFTLSGTFNYDRSVKGNTVTLSGDVVLSNFYAGNVTVEGNVVVKEATATIDEITVNGTVTIDNAKTFTVGNAYVFGTVTAAEATDKVAGTFAATNLYLGLAASDVDDPYVTSLAAAATVAGDVNVSGYMYVLAGSSFPEDMVDEDTPSIELYVEGKLWMTIYAMGTATADQTVDTIPVENVEFQGWATKEGGEGDKNTTVKFSKGKYYADIKYDVYIVEFVIAEGIDDVYLDGVLIQGSSILGTYAPQSVVAGTHTISYTLANGYTGEAKMLVNGTETSGYTFTAEGKFNADVDTPDYVITLQGIEKAPAETAPVVEAEDEGLALTDILLIVLVVLIVIMAIIVALRMMRS